MMLHFWFSIKSVWGSLYTTLPYDSDASLAIQLWNSHIRNSQSDLKAICLRNITICTTILFLSTEFVTTILKNSLLKHITLPLKWALKQRKLEKAEELTLQ